MTVLDSSALLALILREPGYDRVVDVLPHAVLSTANLAEVLTKAGQNGLESEETFRHILDLGIAILPVESLHARLAAKIARAPRRLNLSLGDRLCIALAISLDAELITADRLMAAFTAGVNIRLFR